MADSGRWVTVKGRRVFIADGETPSEAIARSKKEYAKKGKSDPFSKESLYKTRKKAFGGNIDKDTTFEEYYKYKFGEDYSSDMDEDDEVEETRKEFERMKHEALLDKKGERSRQGESDLDMRDRVAEDKAALDKKEHGGRKQSFHDYMKQVKKLENAGYSEKEIISMSRKERDKKIKNGIKRK